MHRSKPFFTTFSFRCVVMIFCMLPAAAISAAQESRTAGYLETLARAEARTNAREWAEAASLWEKVVEQNPFDGRFWSSLGDARYNTRDYLKAIAAYEKVIEIGWGTPADAAYNIASNYALLGEKEPALAWLEKAFQMGFRNLDHARKDTDLQSLRNEERFLKIVSSPDTSRMSRNEGWRYDLALLAREVKRQAYPSLLKENLAAVEAAIKSLHDSIPKLSDVQIVVEMMKLLRKVGDGHTGLIPNSRPEFQQALPVKFYLFKEGLFVIAADPKHKDLLGAQVLRFQDQTVDRVVQALDPLISRDNENATWVQERAPFMMRHPPLLNALGLVPSPREVALTVRAADGQTRTVNLAADASQPNIWNVRPHPASWVSLPQTLAAPVPPYLKNMGATYWFEYMPESKLVYSQFNSVRNDAQESFAQFSGRLLKFVEGNEVEGLVIDLRWNNGGNSFLAQSLVHGLIRSEKINRRGRLFVITGRRTFSAAQNAATFIERHTNAIFVGEPTGSSPNFVGEEDFFTLPYSKLLANVSDLFWQSAWPGDRRRWIAPLIYAPPTFEMYRANRDPAMEAIMDYRKARRD